MTDGMTIDCLVKVGGSLYDLPDLADRLRLLLGYMRNRSYVLVPGGGATVDAIRALDSRHNLGEESSHWLALRALTLNGHFLCQLLTNGQMVADSASALTAWRAGE